MKKLVSFMLVLAAVLILCSCGDVSKAKVTPVKSDIYSEEDINSAIDTALAHFKREFDDCTLENIRYAGDERAEDFEHWRVVSDSDEAIILIMDFETGDSPGTGLNENAPYSDFEMTLVRNDGGQWKFESCGYA